MNKNTVNIHANNLTNKFRFILYAISFIVGIIFAVLIFMKVNIPQNPFDSQAEIYILKFHYASGLFLLVWLCIGLMRIITKQGEIYFQSPLSFEISITFLYTTLLPLCIYVWLFSVDHFPLLVCFITYQLCTLILLLRIRNIQLLTKTTIYMIISFILSISHFLIFKTPNFIYILMLEEFSSTTTYLIIAITLTTILYNGTNIKSRGNCYIFGTMTLLAFISIIFNFLLLKETYYQYGEGEIFATERWLYKTITLILPLIIGYYFFYFRQFLVKKTHPN